MDCSPPGSLVLHCLPEFAQIHVHGVGDAIQPSRPLEDLPDPGIELVIFCTGRQILYHGVTWEALEEVYYKGKHWCLSYSPWLFPAPQTLTQRSTHLFVEWMNEQIS